MQQWMQFINTYSRFSLWQIKEISCLYGLLLHHQMTQNHWDDLCEMYEKKVYTGLKGFHMVVPEYICSNQEDSQLKQAVSMYRQGV